MQSFMNQQQMDADVAQRISSRLVAEEEMRMAQEREQAEAVEAQAWAAVKTQFAQAEDWAEKELAGLRPMFAQRDAMANALIFGEGASLAKFCELEDALESRLTMIRHSLNPHYQRLNPLQERTRWAALWARAGLPESLRTLNVPTPTTDAQRVARSACRAIIAGQVLAAIN